MGKSAQHLKRLSSCRSGPSFTVGGAPFVPPRPSNMVSVSLAPVSCRSPQSPSLRICDWTIPNSFARSKGPCLVSVRLESWPFTDYWRRCPGAAHA